MAAQREFTKYYDYKPLIDFVLAVLFILCFLPLIVVLYLFSSIDTRSSGIFVQPRIGQFGKPFLIYKFRTINPRNRRISRFGKFLRKYKIDEIPQFFNILKGEMSLVGPRPDIAGYYDQLQGGDRNVLKLKPGITSEASIKYSHEEKLLLQQDNPADFNDSVLFPDKVKMNLEYLQKISLKTDIQIVIKTITAIFEK